MELQIIGRENGEKKPQLSFIEKEYDTGPCEPLKHARFNILLIDQIIRRTDEPLSPRSAQSA